MKKYLFFPPCPWLSLPLITREAGVPQCCPMPKEQHRVHWAHGEPEAPRTAILGQPVTPANGWGTGPPYRVQVQALVCKKVREKPGRNCRWCGLPCCLLVWLLFCFAAPKRISTYYCSRKRGHGLWFVILGLEAAGGLVRFMVSNPKEETVIPQIPELQTTPRSKDEHIKLHLC